MGEKRDEINLLKEEILSLSNENKVHESERLSHKQKVDESMNELTGAYKNMAELKKRVDEEVDLNVRMNTQIKTLEEERSLLKQSIRLVEKERLLIENELTTSIENLNVLQKKVDDDERLKKEVEEKKEVDRNICLAVSEMRAEFVEQARLAREKERSNRCTLM